MLDTHGDTTVQVQDDASGGLVRYDADSGEPIGIGTPLRNAGGTPDGRSVVLAADGTVREFRIGPGNVADRDVWVVKAQHGHVLGRSELWEAPASGAPHRIEMSALRVRLTGLRRAATQMVLNGPTLPSEHPANIPAEIDVFPPAVPAVDPHHPPPIPNPPRKDNEHPANSALKRCRQMP